MIDWSKPIRLKSNGERVKYLGPRTGTDHWVEVDGKDQVYTASGTHLAYIGQVSLGAVENISFPDLQREADKRLAEARAERKRQAMNEAMGEHPSWGIF